VPGGHVRLHFAAPAALSAAAALLPAAARDDEALALRVPCDGTPADLRDLLNRLGAGGVQPATLSVHTPDLDDVFLALTGHGARKEPVG
jgi:ABC-2 type transport system ATP-binding protein